MTSPWPAETPKRLLFLLDASNTVERGLLEQWVDRAQDGRSSDCDAGRVAVSLAPSFGRESIQTLTGALDAPPDTLIAPLRVVWTNSVDSKGMRPRLRDLLRRSRERPSARQAAHIVKKDPSRAQCIAAAPATLEALQQRYSARYGASADPAGFAEFVADQATLALAIAERRLRGSRYKVPRRVAENLRISTGFKSALARLAAEVKRPLEDLQKEADGAMSELISTPETFWLDVFGELNRRIAGLGYEPDIVVDKIELERIRQITREYPAALLFTHKTHVDGFALYSVLFDNDFPPPQVLGGANMAFAGLGYLFRRASGIFIRRSFQDDPVYKLVLRHYLGYLLDKRFPLTWAFEGTRSRTGKLMPPRYGLLKYVIESAHATAARNLHIIPVAINYDLIGDVKDYASEQAGAVKQPESLRWFIGYLRGLRQPMGRIYLDFGKPVVLDHAPSGDDRLALAKIAFQVGVEANRVTPITLASLVTLILLGTAPRALTASEMRLQLKRLVAWAAERGIRMTSDFEPDNQKQLAELTEILVTKSFITRYDQGPETVFAITPEQHGTAGYYRNTIIHHFVVKAIAELALARVASAEDDLLAAFWQEAERLRDLFKFEFFYAPSEAFRDELQSELRRYDPRWERALKKDSAFAAKLLSQLPPLVAHATLLPFVEAYRVSAEVLASIPADAGLTEKDCVTRSLSYGRQAYLQRRITSEASIGKLLFQNAYKLMANFGLTEAGDASLAARRVQLSQDFRELAHRIERIRALALPT